MRPAELQRRQALGQYFTPRRIADLAWEALARFYRAEHGTALPTAARVIDPACGGGVFLEAALAAGIGPERLLGIDIDPSLRPALPGTGRVVVGDGLLNHDALDIGAARFDFVVGNPPFRGYGPRPVEVLFAERFVELLRPCGYGAIILPEALLAKARLASFRRWFLSQAELLAVFSLPPSAFTGAGARVATALLVFRKGGGRPVPEDQRRVLLASPDEPLPPDRLDDYLDTLRTALRAGRSEWAMQRQLVEVDRWDPRYFRREYRDLDDTLARLEARPLDSFIEYITYGQVGRRIVSAGGAVRYLQVINLRPTGIDFMQRPDRLVEGSYNDVPRSRVREGDLLLSNTTFGGAWTLLGRCVVVHGIEGPVNISQDIDLVRLRGVDPYYVAAFLKTPELGQRQIQRLCYGVRSNKLSFAQVRAIRIPVPASHVQQAMRTRYLAMAEAHARAMACEQSRPMFLKEAQERHDRLLAEMLRALLG